MQLTTQVIADSLNVETGDCQLYFNELKGEDKSNPEFIAELIECYKIMTGKTCSDIKDERLLKNMLTPSQDDKKSTPEEKAEKQAKKESKLREMFKLDERDPLVVSECEILQVAAKESGKTILEMAKEGRLIIAKNVIGKIASGGGTLGKADDRIKQTYEFIKQSGQKLSLNRLTQLSGSNRKSVENWVVRNEITFE